MLPLLQLQSAKKEGLTVSAYSSKIEEIVENLAMASCPMHEDDFVMHLLQGVPLEYDYIVTSIN